MELQFALCTCYPKSYHRKCLPRYLVNFSPIFNYSIAVKHLISKTLMFFCWSYSCYINQKKIFWRLKGKRYHTEGLGWSSPKSYLDLLSACSYFWGYLFLLYLCIENVIIVCRYFVTNLTFGDCVWGHHSGSFYGKKLYVLYLKLVLLLLLKFRTGSLLMRDLYWF